jgi:D-mannonate dehydratase
VPSITGYEDVGGGYTVLGLLFAVGYMKGLMEAVYKGA